MRTTSPASWSTRTTTRRSWRWRWRGCPPCRLDGPRHRGAGARPPPRCRRRERALDRSIVALEDRTRACHQASCAVARIDGDLDVVRADRVLVELCGTDNECPRDDDRGGRRAGARDGMGVDARCQLRCLRRRDGFRPPQYARAGRWMPAPTNWGYGRYAGRFDALKKT